jgi:hypothetical protein
MIVYDLKCQKKHVFEAWFRDSSAYETQAASGKVVCPECGSKKVSKAPMAPNVARVQSPSNSEQRQQAAQALKMLREVREQVEKNCDNVGDKFAEEARKIHYGETKARAIYGNASKEEAEELHDEGVEFGVIPWVPRTDA